MTINEMLREAITTDSRKRKCRWQTELEALGFEIIKEGSWFIRYKKTGRFVELPYNDNYLRTNTKYIRFGYMGYGKNSKELSTINLEGLLTKRPVKNNCSDFTNVTRMKNALYNKKYHENILDNAMNEYQKRIDILTKEYQKKIEDAKRSYDWNMKYHTESLADTNTIISELLHKTA